MKKIILAVLILLAIFFIGYIHEKKVPISEDKKYVGIWVLTSATPVDDGLLEAATFQFFEDGNCIFAYRYNTQRDRRGSEFEAKYEGKCYLNVFKRKFKMDGSSSYYTDWVSFKDNGIN